MRKLALYFVIILCIAAIIFSKFSYDKKLNSIASSATTELEMLEEERQESEKQRIQKEKEEQKQEQERERAWLEQMTEGLEQSVKELIIERYIHDEQIHIVAFGSRAQTDSQNEQIIPWPQLLEEILNEAYEKELFTIESISYGSGTSLQILQDESYDDVIASEPDIIIFEAPVWNDNGQVLMRDTLDALTIVINAFMRENDQSIIFIQPPQPVYNSVYYPENVEQLKQHAAVNNLIYMDHWEDWPEINDEDLLKYVDEEHRMPTQAGHELWSESLTKHFMKR